MEKRKGRKGKKGGGKDRKGEKAGREGRKGNGEVGMAVRGRGSEKEEKSNYSSFRLKINGLDSRLILNRYDRPS